MKKLIFLALSAVSLFAKEKINQPDTLPAAKFPLPSIELKMGYFCFNTSPMNKVFNEGGFDVQLTGIYPLCRNLGLYASVEYLQKSGRSLGAHQKTSFWDVPLSLGIQPTVALTKDESIRYYISLGPRYVFASTNNHSSYVPHHLSANNIGGFVNTGFMFKFYDHLSFDLFGEYSYVKLDFHSSKKGTEGHDVQAGGFLFGGGLAYDF